MALDILQGDADILLKLVDKLPDASKRLQVHELHARQEAQLQAAAAYAADDEELLQQQLEQLAVHDNGLRRNSDGQALGSLSHAPATEAHSKAARPAAAASKQTAHAAQHSDVPTSTPWLGGSSKPQPKPARTSQQRAAAPATFAITADATSASSISSAATASTSSSAATAAVQQQQQPQQQGRGPRKTPSFAAALARARDGPLAGLAAAGQASSKQQADAEEEFPSLPSSASSASSRKQCAPAAATAAPARSAAAAAASALDGLGLAWPGPPPEADASTAAAADSAAAAEQQHTASDASGPGNRCAVCLDAAADVALRPCGHTMCRACLHLWRAQTAAKDVAGTHCPFCRAHIKSYKHVSTSSSSSSSAPAAEPTAAPAAASRSSSSGEPARSIAQASQQEQLAGTQQQVVQQQVTKQRVPRGLPPPRDAPVIVWLRRDLRLLDNPALHHASCLGLPVLPVYIWAPQELGRWADRRAVRLQDMGMPHPPHPHPPTHTHSPVLICYASWMQ